MLFRKLAMATRAFSTTENREAVSPTVPVTEPSALSAAERAVEAAQRIVVERLELMRLELQEAVTRLVERTGLMFMAGIVVLLGWCGLAVALVMLLAERMPLVGSLAVVAGGHVLVGILMAVVVMSMTGRKTT